jgi:hypothetical protein
MHRFTAGYHRHSPSRSQHDGATGLHALRRAELLQEINQPSIAGGGGGGAQQPPQLPLVGAAAEGGEEAEAEEEERRENEVLRVAAARARSFQLVAEARSPAPTAATAAAAPSNTSATKQHLPLGTPGGVSTPSPARCGALDAGPRGGGAAGGWNGSCAGAGSPATTLPTRGEQEQEEEERGEEGEKEEAALPAAAAAGAVGAGPQKGGGGHARGDAAERPSAAARGPAAVAAASPAIPLELAAEVVAPQRTAVRPMAAAAAGVGGEGDLFAAAVWWLKHSPPRPEAAPASNEVKLKLYGLYKQGSTGAGPASPQPGWWSCVRACFVRVLAGILGRSGCSPLGTATQ